MGNFYCIPSSCAEVVYREYLPPVVRWRYEGEDWQEIEADDYDTEQKQWQCPVPYRFFVAYETTVSSGVTRSESAVLQGIPGGIPREPEFRSSNPQGRGDLLVDIYAQNNSEEPFLRNYKLNQSNRWRCTQLQVDNIKLLQSYTFTRTDDRPDDCGECKFTVYRNQEIVYEETRDTCPEVERLPCRLSDEIKSIKITKSSWTQKVQVVDNYSSFDAIAAFEEFLFGEIPTHCREVWRTPSLDYPNFLIGNGKPTFFYEDYQLIAQICSAPNCPPPEYEVICDCDSCESCPDGTCPVECGDHVCCYDTTTGTAVREIPIDEYCGG